MNIELPTIIEDAYDAVLLLLGVGMGMALMGLTLSIAGGDDIKNITKKESGVLNEDAACRTIFNADYGYGNSLLDLRCFVNHTWYDVDEQDLHAALNQSFTLDKERKDKICSVDIGSPIPQPFIWGEKVPITLENNVTGEPIEKVEVDFSYTTKGISYTWQTVKTHWGKMSFQLDSPEPNPTEHIILLKAKDLSEECLSKAEMFRIVSADNIQ